MKSELQNDASKKKSILVGIAVGILFGIISIALKYDMNWMIGKHYEDIVERYGQFDFGFSDEIPCRKIYGGTYLSKDGEVLNLDNTAAYIVYNVFQRTYDSTGEGEEFPCIVVEFDDKGYVIGISKGYAIPNTLRL